MMLEAVYPQCVVLGAVHAWCVLLRAVHPWCTVLGVVHPECVVLGAVQAWCMVLGGSLPLVLGLYSHHSLARWPYGVLGEHPLQRDAAP